MTLNFVIVTYKLLDIASLKSNSLLTLTPRDTKKYKSQQVVKMKEGSVELNTVPLMWLKRSHVSRVILFICHRHHKNTDWKNINHSWEVVTTAVTQNTANSINPIVVKDCNGKLCAYNSVQRRECLLLQNLIRMYSIRVLF